MMYNAELQYSKWEIKNNANPIDTMPLYVKYMTLLLVCWDYFSYS